MMMVVGCIQYNGNAVKGGVVGCWDKRLFSLAIYDRTQGVGEFKDHDFESFLVISIVVN